MKRAALLLLLPLLLAAKPAPPPPAPPPSVRLGVEKWRVGDYPAAVAIWAPFAANGDVDALFNMGQAYKLGRGVPVDLAQARDYYRKAAVKGSLPAQANLGILLFQAGEKPEAVRWLAAAADHGEMRAQYVLGVATYNGDGVRRNVPLGYAYLLRASRSGLPQATSALGPITPLLSYYDRANGETIANALAAGQGVPPAFALNAIPPMQAATAPAAAPPVLLKPQPGPVVAAPTPASSVPPPAPRVAAAMPTPKPAQLPPVVAIPKPPVVAAVVAPKPAADELAAKPVAPQLAPPPVATPVTVAPAQPKPEPVKLAEPVKPPEPVKPTGAIPPDAVKPEAARSAAVKVEVATPLPPKPDSPKPTKVEPATAEPAKPKPVTGYRVQLGAFSGRALADKAWASVKASQRDLLGDSGPLFESTGGIVKLQLGPLPSRDAARILCAKLSAAGRACFIVTPTP